MSLLKINKILKKECSPCKKCGNHLSVMFNLEDMGYIAACKKSCQGIFLLKESDPRTMTVKNIKLVWEKINVG